MPTKRHRVERFRIRGVDPAHIALLTDAELPDDGEFAELSFDEQARGLWSEHRERILRDWIATRPGTRPSMWWRFDAPRDPRLGKGCYYAADMIQGRQLISGEGRPAWEAVCLVPSWRLGIPAVWYGDPAALVFESQYDYLRRHGLLERGERRAAAGPVVVPRRWTV